MTLKEKQEEFIKDFNELDDWFTQYAYLLELSTLIDSPSESEKNDDTLVAGCQSKLWVSMTYEDGKVRMKADSDALIVKGIVSVFVTLADNRTPEEIVNTEFDFIEKTALKTQLSADRFKGMKILTKMIRDFAADNLSE